MIDLHSHILPDLDDGASSLNEAIKMARIAVADGITHMVATPHILPGLYDNTSANIIVSLVALRRALQERQIELNLYMGADVHVMPDLDRLLQAGIIPTISHSRYFLLEPPHQVMPPRLEQVAAGLVKRGYIPILTHPERLGWINNHYKTILRMSESGVLLQVTAGSLTGQFGKREQYWAERLLEERRIDLLASDAHNAYSRPPLLSAARAVVAHQLGEAEAQRMVVDAPSAILNDGAFARISSAQCSRIRWSPMISPNIQQSISDSRLS